MTNVETAVEVTTEKCWHNVKKVKEQLTNVKIAVDKTYLNNS